jgi:hypothetical protein
VIFGGDQGWISDSFVLDWQKGEISKEEYALKKPEEFGSGQYVKWQNKVYCVGCIDRDVHVYSLQARRWNLLEKWFVEW